jgi:MFS family permease
MSMPHAAGRPAWQTPAVIIICGCLIALVSFGPRSGLGFFLTPQTQANGWGRDVFALALALQNLLWGIGQPFAGALADRYGSVRVLSGGALLYGLGLILMAYSTTPLALNLSAGALIGFGLSGCTFTIVLAAFGKLVPESWRSIAFGAGTAAGSFGQFLFSPLAVGLIDFAGWQNALIVFGIIILVVLPLSLALATPPAGAAPAGAGSDQARAS